MCAAPREEFRLLAFGTYGWDVTAALEIAADLPIQQLDVERLYSWLPVIGVNADHAAGTDLERPVLAVMVAELGGLMLIDGWHRLHRARTEGRTHLPCRVLDEEQEFRVRQFGGRKGPDPGPAQGGT